MVGCSIKKLFLVCHNICHNNLPKTMKRSVSILLLRIVKVLIITIIAIMNFRTYTFSEVSSGFEPLYEVLQTPASNALLIGMYETMHPICHI